MGANGKSAACAAILLFQPLYCGSLVGGQQLTVAVSFYDWADYYSVGMQSVTSHQLCLSMSQVFRDPLMMELGLSLDQIDRLFPRLDELYELHSGFLRSLQALQTVNADRSVDEIGPTLLKQVSWGGGKGGRGLEVEHGEYVNGCMFHPGAVYCSC